MTPAGRMEGGALLSARESLGLLYGIKMNGSLMETMYQVQREATEQVERLPNKY